MQLTDSLLGCCSLGPSRDREPLDQAEQRKRWQTHGKGVFRRFRNDKIFAVKLLLFKLLSLGI